jgi:pimeloyl-ACP methyl ester carboxylesterase
MENTRTITLNGMRTTLHDAGDGAPLLFLHGNSSRWQHWKPQLDSFAGQFRCLAFDQRGFGTTVAPPGMSLTRMADDAAALCRELGLARVAAIGLSMGGAVAEVLALRHPALTAAIVAAAPPALPVPEALPAGAERPVPSRDDFRALFDVSFSARFKVEHPDLVERLIADCLETDLSNLRHFETVDVADFDPARIATPALIIGGSEDALAPVGPLRGLAAALPRGEYFEIAGSGHWLNVEQPGVFHVAVGAFLRRVGYA